MTLTTRPLIGDDFDQALALGREAFGVPTPGAPPANREGWPGPGRHAWGTFDGGALVACMTGCEYRSWYGGGEVPTCGVASVTVAAERRGGGLLDGLFRAALAEGRGRGEVISTLFPTAPGIYRAFGYELIGSYDAIELPTAALTGVRPAPGVRVRRAAAADFDAVRRVYDAWGSAQNGPLTRRGVSFPVSGESFVAAFTGVTLAEDADGRVVGYASWHRGQGYDETSTIKVSDLLALDAAAYRALWRVLGSFASVTGHVQVRSSGLDVARFALPSLAWRLARSQSYMLRVHDVAGAFGLRRLPGKVDLVFSVAGDRLGTMDGTYRLQARDGATACERVEADPGAPAFDPQGLALAYAGAQSCANIRMAGHLSGGSPATDALIDHLFGGRQVHIRDYF